MSAHRQHRNVRRGTAALTAGAAALGLAVLGPAAPATAVSTTVTTEPQVKAALSDATNDTVVLGANITISDGTSVHVSVVKPKTLDLNGRSLTITNTNLTAVEVPAGAALTITDALGGGSLHATTAGNLGTSIGSSDGAAGSITITGGAVTAGAGGDTGPGVGNAFDFGGPGGSVTVSGGTLNATGGQGPGIRVGDTVRITGGSVTATTTDLGAGIRAFAGGSIAISGGTVLASSADGGAGIGIDATGSVTISGGTVTASGGLGGGAGIGGAPFVSGGSVQISGGTVTATGAGGGAGIGGGFGSTQPGGGGGNGGSVFIGPAAHVTAIDGRDGRSSAIGGGTLDFGTGAFGSLTNMGDLTIPAGATLRIPTGTTVENGGVIHLAGTITGVSSPPTSRGTVHNTGAIVPTGTGSVANDGVGGTNRLLVSVHNYLVSFNVNGGPAATPAPLRTFADTVAHGGRTLPGLSVPGFTGWFTAPVGGIEVVDTTDLSTVAPNGPSSLILYAHYQQEQSIAFPPIADHTYGDADFDPGASASSNLPVSYATTTPDVCAISSSNQVHLVAVGSCTVVASQDGDPTHLPAQSVDRTFAVDPASLTVTASDGSFGYGGTPPTITPSYSGFVNGEDASVLTAAPTCSTGATATSPVGDYDSSCGAAAAANYAINYANGTVSVTPAPLAITASNATFATGTAAPTITPSYSGFVNGEDASVLTAAPTCSTTATSASVPGTYPATCSGAAAHNYAIGYVDGTVTVVPALSTGTTTCTGTFGGTGKDVIVPAGATCILLPGTVVTHDVTVRTDASLTCEQASIRHDLSADGAARFDIEGCAIGHDASVHNSTGPVQIIGTTIGHDLTIQNNTGGVTLTGNTIGHDAVCTGNTPPATGGGNTVGHNNNGCPV